MSRLWYTRELAMVISLSAFRLKPKHFASYCSSTVTRTSFHDHTASITIPLFERTPIEQVQLRQLLEWRNWAREQAIAVGSKYYELDNGPDSKELLHEVDWYLQDAVAEIEGVGDWKTLKLDMEDPEMATSVGHKETCAVNLRASLKDLERNWRERIEMRRPFHYLVGCVHWRGFVLNVEEGVIIPRAETGQLVDLASAAMVADESLRNGMWADLGTGTGAIAIGIAQQLQERGSVLAVDINDKAVAVARYNVKRYQLQDQVNVVHGSWFEPLQGRKVSGLLSNPPYVPSTNMTRLQAEVGKHEPVSALDGGWAGLDSLLLICDGSATYLQAGGFLALETKGEDQAYAVAEYLSSMIGPCFEHVQVLEDSYNTPRFVTALHC